MSIQQVRKYYSEIGLKEWRRLARDTYHWLEFDTTMHFFRKYAPADGLVLDAGGGPGRYTITFAKMGYDVVLLDLTPKLLEIAKKQIARAKVEDRVRQVCRGSVDDLSMFEDETFDVVTCLGGPLSHILSRKRRRKATDELIRVAKKNAPIFVSANGRLAMLICAFVHWPTEIEHNKHYLKFYVSGDHFGDRGVYAGGRTFAPCHFYLREELENAFKDKVKVLEMVGLEGLSTRRPKETNRLFRKYPDSWRNWQEIHLRTCTLPSVVDLSQHMMIICKK